MIFLLLESVMKVILCGDWVFAWGFASVSVGLCFLVLGVYHGF